MKADTDIKRYVNVVRGDIVTPLVLCKLKVPLDKYMDGYNDAMEFCEDYSRVEFTQYRPKWIIYKKIKMK